MTPFGVLSSNETEGDVASLARLGPSEIPSSWCLSFRLHLVGPRVMTLEMLSVFFGPQDPIELAGAIALLGDYSRTGIEKVDARFIGTQARLSRSIQFLEVAKQVAPEILRPSIPPKAPEAEVGIVWHPAPPGAERNQSSLSDLPARVFLFIWRLFPNRLRIAAYDLLRVIGGRLYTKPNSYSPVCKLPFGLFLKYGDVARSRNEFNALQTVWQHTSVPIPKPLDLAVTTVNRDEQAYLLITTLPGVTLADYEVFLTDRDCAYISAQLKDYFAQVRAIPRSTPANSPGMAICDTLGLGCKDNRVGILLGRSRTRLLSARCCASRTTPPAAATEYCSHTRTSTHGTYSSTE
ncbi:hypothetical protein C8Q72DRAFT_811982 [Fomitopsis betulina]|nr:hypothetical protein C8Q72DRAFT_811982 [Fomitopsis betulina]